jgi:hypothetical protein
VEVSVEDQQQDSGANPGAQQDLPSPDRNQYHSDEADHARSLPELVQAMPKRQ